jgi:hypothetical protein
MKWNEFWTWFCLAGVLINVTSTVQANIAEVFDRATFHLLWTIIWVYLLSLQSKPTEKKP